jgi:hypothetical protein
VGKTSLGAEPRFELGPALKYTYPDPYFEFEDSYKKVLNPYTGILYTTKYRKIFCDIIENPKNSWYLLSQKGLGHEMNWNLVDLHG